ncbi:spore coat protein [Marinicrinis lubricantis]
MYMNFDSLNVPGQFTVPMFHFSDRDFAFVIMSELKRMASEYTTACLESSREDIRRMFEMKLQNTLSKQAYLHQMMSQFQFSDTPASVSRQQVLNEVQQQSDAGFKLQSYMHDRLHAGPAYAQEQGYIGQQQPMIGNMQIAQTSFTGFGQMQSVPQEYNSSNLYGTPSMSYSGYSMPQENRPDASYSPITQEERSGGAQTSQTANLYTSAQGVSEQSRAGASVQSRSASAGTKTEQGEYTMQNNRQAGKQAGTDPNLNLNPNASQDQTQARTSGYAVNSSANETTARNQNQEQQLAGSQQALNNTYRSGPADSAADTASQNGTALSQSAGASDADYHVGTNAQMNAGATSETDDPMDKYFS